MQKKGQEDAVDRFQGAVTAVPAAHARASLKNDRKAVEEWLGNVIVGRSHNPKPRKLRRDEHLSLRLLAGFAEIRDSLEMLNSLAKLARRSPDRAIGVSKLAYLRFLVEAYLGEVYIFRERCFAYLTLVERAHRQGSAGKKIREVTERLRSIMDAGFKGLVVARGEHVHRSRHEDDDLRRLNTLHLIAGSDPGLNWIRDGAFRDIKRKKIEWMTRNNRALREGLNVFCSELQPLLFNADESPRYPQPARKT
jgi:hypothetical protein